MRQATVWTNDDLLCWRILASFGLNDLIRNYILISHSSMLLHTVCYFESLYITNNHHFSVKGFQKASISCYYLASLLCFHSSRSDKFISQSIRTYLQSHLSEISIELIHDIFNLITYCITPFLKSLHGILRIFSYHYSQAHFSLLLQGHVRKVSASERKHYTRNTFFKLTWTENKI